MARINLATKQPPIFTAEGGKAKHITPEQQLRRLVMSCLLWEDGFYTDGLMIADAIKAACDNVRPEAIAGLAIEARSQMHLRHVPLYLTAILAGKTNGTSLVRDTIADVIQRADELAEFVAIYAKVNGVTPDKVKPKLSNQVRKGLAQAFMKFKPYALAKYNRDNAVKLRDVLFLCHAKPRDAEQAETWKQLIEGTLASPDTWEVELSSGKDKRETFERLIREDKLGYLALLRNLRNMDQAGVDPGLVRQAILARKGGAERVLPFRFIAAARAAKAFEPALDESLLSTLREMPVLPGRTAVLVDVSGSMNDKLSVRSDMTRCDAACALASMINADYLRVFSFSDAVAEIPPRRGMAGVDAIQNSQPRGGTRLFDAVALINRDVPYDRLIVITDEQSHGRTMYGSNRLGGGLSSMPDPVGEHAYVINVAAEKNGLGYGKWTHLDGFSESVLRWIVENEKAV